MKRKVIIEVEAVVEFNEFDVQEKNKRDKRIGKFLKTSDFRGGQLSNDDEGRISVHYGKVVGWRYGK